MFCVAVESLIWNATVSRYADLDFPCQEWLNTPTRVADLEAMLRTLQPDYVAAQDLNISWKMFLYYTSSDNISLWFGIICKSCRA